MAETRQSPPRATDFGSYFLTSRAFDQASYERDWLVRQVLVRGQPGVLGGPKKCLKTSLSIDLAVSLGSGTPFLGRFDVPRKARVTVLSGESGQAVAQETARRVCTQKGISLGDCDVLWSFGLPRLDVAGDRLWLKAFLGALDVEVVVIDPLYLCLLSGGAGVSAASLYEIGRLLWEAGQACLDAGATPVFVHHTTKGPAWRAGSLDLDGLAFTGIGEYARQWLLVSRRWPYQPGSGAHHLLLAVGGSAGHSSCWEVDVTEGVPDDDFGGREWQVRVAEWAGTAWAAAREPAPPSGTRPRRPVTRAPLGDMEVRG
jgi:replicative DNA helicase